jgi:hypothetical protein
MIRRRLGDRAASHARPTLHRCCARIARAVAFVLVTALAAAGCGRSDIVAVSGRVTWEGRPVPKAVVQFVHEARPMAFAGTDAEGRYRLTTRRPMDGAYIGRHKVTVAPLISGAASDSEAAALRARTDIPSVVRDATTSPLAVEVTAAGPNQFDFDLAKHAGTKR